MRISILALVLFTLFGLLACGNSRSPAGSSVQADTTDVLNWGDRFRMMYGSTIFGWTDDNRRCTFSVFDQSVNGNSVCGTGRHRKAYINLGTDAGRDNFNTTYIGFLVNPDCTYRSPYLAKAMDVNPRSVHINVLSDEVDLKNVENDLYIVTDAGGRVTEVRGWSSHYPASTCYFR